MSGRHYIEIESPDGKLRRFTAQDLICAICMVCHARQWLESNLGNMRCAHCAGPLECVWGRAELAFLPEVGAHFSSAPPPPPREEG